MDNSVTNQNQFQDFEKILNPKYFIFLKSDLQEKLKASEILEKQEISSSEPVKLLEIKARYKRERKEIFENYTFSVLENGYITEHLALFFNFENESFGLVNIHKDTVLRLQFFKSEKSVKNIILDNFPKLNPKLISFTSLPKVRLGFNPKKPFGIIRGSKEKTGFRIFNSHFEPNFIVSNSPTIPKPIQELLENLFENEIGIEYSLNWLANMIQRNKNETAILLQGIEGSGKGTLRRIIGKMIGDDNVSELGNASLQSSWNDDIINKRFIVFNEVSDHSRDQNVGNKLKAYVTDEVLPVYARFQSTYKIENHANILIATNGEKSIQISFTDRRYSIFSQKKKLDENIAKEVYSLSENEILSFKSFLLNRDLSNWDSRNPLENETRKKAMMTTNTKKNVLIHYLSKREFKEIYQIILDLFEEIENSQTSKTDFPEFLSELVKGTNLSKTKFTDITVTEIEHFFDHSDISEKLDKKDFRFQTLFDFDVLENVGRLTSRLATLLFRYFVDQPKSSTTAIGRFYSESFGKSKVFKNYNGGTFKAYEI
jgi:hypothetical protein